MRITIFGASGGVGKELVRQAAEAGNSVRAVVRPGANTVASPGVERMEVDDVCSRDSIASAIDGCDVVLSSLGIRRAYPNNPWSKIVSPITLNQYFAAALVEVLQARTPTPRVIVVSAAGVGESRPRMNAALRWLFDHSNVGVAYSDLEVMESRLSDSPLHWMAVRPVTLANGPKTGRIKVVENFGLFAKIRRADVAAFIMEQLTRPLAESRTPMIANG